MTSCNHAIHVSCYNTIYGNREYTYCNFCKSTSNFLACIDTSSSMDIENQISGLERLEAGIAIIDANEEENMGKYEN